MSNEKLASQNLAARPRATVVAVALGWLFSAVDIILLILFQSEVAEALNVPAQSIKIAIGVGLLGSAVGGLGFSPLGDRFGRVRALGWAIVLYSIATAGMAFAPNIATLMALRFVAGIGTGGEWSIGFALLAEVWPAKSRGKMGGLVAAMFNVGTFIAIALYHSGLGWRMAFGVMIFPALGVAVLRRLVPESPVWVEFARAREAGTLSERLRKAVKRPPVLSVFHVDTLALTLKAILLFTLMNLGFYAFSTIFIGYLQSAPDTGGLGLTKEQELPYHLALNISGLVSVFLAGLLSDKLGRRATYAGFCAMGAMGFGCLYFILGNPFDPAQQGSLIAVFSLCCMGFGINGVMGILIPELYPTHLRSTGPGVCQNLGKGVGGMVGPPVAGMLVLSMGYQFVLAMPGLIFLVLVILIWTLPEAGGRTLRAVEDTDYLDESA